LAAVADYDVVAVAGADQVAETPADDDVVAAGACYAVRTASVRRRGAGDLIEVGRVEITVVVQEAVVAQDDVVVVGAGGGKIAYGDGVAVVSPQDAVAAGARGDLVGPANAECHRLNAVKRDGQPAEVRRGRGRGSNLAAVADDDVAAV